jgi:hypothetical protein
MEESGIRISSFCERPTFKKSLQNKGLFGKEFKPIKTPMSEGYHPEIDDSPLFIERDPAKYR